VKSTGIEIKTGEVGGEEAMRKPGEGTKGVEDKEGENNRFWN
jgi:hypothetical protein